MKDELETVEQDIRQWGQRQALKLDHDDIAALRVLCDRLSGIRRGLAKVAEAAMTPEKRTWK